MNNTAGDDPDTTITEVRSPGDVEEGLPLRSVAFPPAPDENDNEKAGAHTFAHRPRGVEMRREMTKEDKELAAAGYEHLEQEKAKAVKGGSGRNAELENVDIFEHGLTFAALEEELSTDIDAKSPSSTAGLSAEEATARLLRDGRNVLTPPKKRSALRKVGWHHNFVYLKPFPLMLSSLVFRLSPDYVQHLVNYCWYLGIHTPRHKLSCKFR